MEGIRGIQHPLQTPLVLECIFKSLGVSDLKACRQVCKAWGEEATRVMRPLTQVHIQGHEGGKGVADFLELVQSEASTFSESPFVSKFQIRDLTYAEKDRAFWEFCGRRIKSLHLFNASFPTDNEFGHALFQSCPNLEELFLKDVKVNPEGNLGDQPVIWMPSRFPQNRNLKSLNLEDNLITGRSRMAILSHFPCLQELKSESNYVKVDWIFRSLAILRERDNEGWPLKSIAVDFNHFKEPLAILPVLVEGNLTLEEFDAYGIEGHAHGVVLGRILEAHAKTLQKLSLVSWGTMEVDLVAPLKNMRFKKLEILDLHCVDLSSTNLLRNVPNLRRLNIYGSRVVNPEDPNVDWVLTNCTQLGLHDMGIGELRNLLRRLPNLETLQMIRCGNEMFAVICELCPNLAYLGLCECEVDDCGISGLEVEDVERINQEGAEGWTGWRPITVARPNLTSLKSLKWLRLFAREGHPLGFCAALCGVQQLPYANVEVYSWNPRMNLLG